MAPISLAILNPIAFVLMEVNKQKEICQNAQLASTDPSRKPELSKIKLLKQIFKGIAYNPVLVMTVLGIIGNIAFKHQLSIYIEGLLEVCIYLLLFFVQHMCCISSSIGRMGTLINFVFIDRYLAKLSQHQPYSYLDFVW